jgi:hypothetical protein
VGSATLTSKLETQLALRAHLAVGSLAPRRICARLALFEWHPSLPDPQPVPTCRVRDTRVSPSSRNAGDTIVGSCARCGQSPRMFGTPSFVQVRRGGPVNAASTTEPPGLILGKRGPDDRYGTPIRPVRNGPYDNPTSSNDGCGRGQVSPSTAAVPQTARVAEDSGATGSVLGTLVRSLAQPSAHAGRRYRSIVERGAARSLDMPTRMGQNS